MDKQRFVDNWCPIFVMVVLFVSLAIAHVKLANCGTQLAACQEPVTWCESEASDE